MPDRLLIPAIAFIATTSLAAQVAPREAAKAFTLDSVAPTPTPTPTPTPDAMPSATDAASTPASPSVAVPVPVVDKTSSAIDAPTITAPTLPESTAVTAPSAATATPATNAAPAVRGVFTLDTPIQDLIVDPDAKAVLDKDLPGMSDDENLAKFKMLSLRSLQPQTGGQLTDAMLAKVASDLDRLAGGTGAATAPVKVGSEKRSKDDSR